MQEIRQLLSEEDTVIFVGSGISVWSGLPTWHGIIAQLVTFLENAGIQADMVNSEFQKGDLLQAASYGFDKMSKQQIGHFVRSACRYGTARPHDIHKKLVTLGPRCFVTTNYDDLIEQSLRHCFPDRFLRPSVTNRHLTEIAEITHARSIDFIFKPHGDAGDIDSIILTREQYRQLLPNGNRQSALESLKMLMVTRPIVYFGYSLQDPDFLYIRDILSNTYKGGTRDHYAIMADVSEAQIDYWRRNYGIHLVSYQTKPLPNGSKNHEDLLRILDTLGEVPARGPSHSIDPTAAETRLSLARYAAGLSRAPKVASELQIRVHAKNTHRNFFSDRIRVGEYDHYSVGKFLTDGPAHAVLTGLPGAGKSYAFRRAAAVLADKLQAACLSDQFDPPQLTIPVLADLKLYRGDIKALVNQSLPAGFDLNYLQTAFRLKIFLDAFNEMPREYWESSTYEADLDNFTKGVTSHSVIIGSRTDDGLRSISFPVYDLDQIDERTVASIISESGIIVSASFEFEMHALFSRPFYLKLISELGEWLPENPRPSDLYKLFFEKSLQQLKPEWGKASDVLESLTSVAFSALNDGEEAFPLNNLITILAGNQAARDDQKHSVALEIANWLISQNILVPYTGSRIAFVHQSITEYLAALELARKYSTDPRIMNDTLSLKRWDQALFLTVGLLDGDQSGRFLDRIIAADLELALRSAKYVEYGQAEIVTKLLNSIIDMDSDFLDQFQLSNALGYGLPVAAIHEEQLFSIAQRGDVIGSAAATALVSLKGGEAKDTLLQLMLTHKDDYNLCANGIGRALLPYATDADAFLVADWIRIMKPTESENELRGFISGAGSLLSATPIEVLKRAFFPIDQPDFNRELADEILCTAIRDRRSNESLRLAFELLENGCLHSIVTIYFIGNYKWGDDRYLEDNDKGLDWGFVTSAHTSRLILELEAGEQWSHKTLKLVCERRPDLSHFVEKEAEGKDGLVRLALLQCVANPDPQSLFSVLEEFAGLDQTQLPLISFEKMGEIDVDWRGREDLFLKLLQLRSDKLASALLGGALPPMLDSLGNLNNIGPIHWWLDWIRDIAMTGNENSRWIAMQIGGCLGGHLENSDQHLFVAELNKTKSEFRHILIEFVLPYFNELSSDDLNEDAISFLLADLSRTSPSFSFKGHLLGRIATERFVADRLIPLLPNTSEAFGGAIRKVIKQAGDRHGRRYIT